MYKRGSRKGKQGFASMTLEKRTALARMGGLASSRSGKAHRFNSEEGAAAGRIGGAKGKGRKKKINSFSECETL